MSKEIETKLPVDAATACSPGDIANGLLHAADDHPCCKATLHAAANLLANMESPDRDYTQPLRRAYSREEMRDASVKWMIEQYGRPIELDSEAKDCWHERCGMLYHFIFDHFPENTHDQERKSPASDGSN